MGSAVLMVAAVVSGCGGDSGSAPGTGFLDGGGDGGVVQFKSTDTTQFNPMVKQMQESMRKRDYTKKPTPPKDTKGEKK
jgi:hypothetical protein